jgi:hypothetical protein
MVFPQVEFYMDNILSYLIRIWKFIYGYSYLNIQMEKWYEYVGMCKRLVRFKLK